MRKVDKTRIFVALIVTSFAVGFILETPLGFLAYMAAASTIIAIVMNAPTREYRKVSCRFYG